MGRIRGKVQQIVLWGSLSIAGYAGAAGAQTPMTRDAFKTVLDDAAKTSTLVDSVDALILGVSRRAFTLAETITKHNEDQCQSLADQPGLCADYQREGQDLNANLASIRKEWAGYEVSRRAFRAHFGKLMDQMRSAAYSGRLASFKAPVVSCTNLDLFPDVVSCLTKEWKQMP